MSSCGNNGIDIIFEDNHLLVVKKMLTLLKEDIKKRYNKPGNVYLGLVHRLDLESRIKTFRPGTHQTI